ncbi:hypothetical protein [Azospirillum sp. TSO22-1]|uniref:hypothetical protein n=1 Tax=Azospirillum sp. TSO22-1 TaxID=716789 RepID=UPI0011B5D81B|nr:hypothetical protein [Azospirillum sp. TSO22-1]
MARVLRCCALALAVFSFVSVCGAETLDCWLLTGNALDRARQQGMCLDTFARNTNDATPSHGGKVASSKGGSKHAAGADGLKTTALPPKPNRAGAGDDDDTRPMSSQPPGVDPEPMQTYTAEVRPPVPRDPVADALSAVQRELERFTRDVERDFGLVGRALLQGGSSGTPSHSPHSGR